MAQLRQAAADETAGAPVTGRVTDRATLRDDVVHPDPIGKTVLENAPGSDGEFFRVPKVID